MPTPQLSIVEAFARFFESPSRDKLRDLLRQQTGEYDFIDFKEAWPDRFELARHILAFANSGNGCIVVGVAENDDGTFDVRGVQNIKDKTQIKESVNKYLPATVAFDIHDFEFRDSEYDAIRGKSFQVLLAVHDPLSIPALSLADGSSLKRNRIYVRSKSSSTEADHMAVQTLIETRLAASAIPKHVRDFEHHLSQLYALYEYRRSAFVSFAYIDSLDGKAEFYRFIEQMISRKQQMIQQIVESVE